MKVNYNGKKFRSVSNSSNGDVSTETIFHYFQEGQIIWGQYRGGMILKGNLIAKVADNGILEMRYQHINNKGDFMTGKCHSTPEIMEDGKLMLHEKWEWTSGDLTSGESKIIEF